jgi:glutamyl-tRNA synthetase
MAEISRNTVEMNKKIRVRIAPSPTGKLHVGTARAALYNWLFARKFGGDFILRIEDTDKARSKPEYEQDIIDHLKWLGLNWDEGPVRQSERLSNYKPHFEKLINGGKAYYCFCSNEELEENRRQAQRAKMAPVYSGKCRELSKSIAEKRLASGEAAIVRFKMSPGVITFKDIIQGDISFDSATIGDFSIAKNLESPLYNFAVVIDDNEMKITHVIRGVDHIANTPKQIALQEALGFNKPEYAHLPLLLNADRSKMSKRASSTDVADFKEQGYLPEALFNFLALLGWHPKNNRDEVMTKDELLKEFELERVQKGGAIFDLEKLKWMNSQYIKRMPAVELSRRLGLKPEETNLKIIDLARDRMKTMSDFKSLTFFLTEIPHYEPQLLIWKTMPREKTRRNLAQAQNVLKSISNDDFTASSLEKSLADLMEREGKGEVLWPLRVALSGQKSSPGPFEIMEVLGKKEVSRRISDAVKKLE